MPSSAHVLRQVIISLALVGVLPSFAVASDGSASTSSARLTLNDLPTEVQEALTDGEVVLLEDETDGSVVTTKVVALIPASPAEVVSEIRDYRQLKRIHRGLRSISFARGDHRDTYSMQVKPHSMVPVMSLSSEVSFALDEHGDARVDTELVSSSYAPLEAHSSAWRLFLAGDKRTLAVYETRGQFSSLPFRSKVLKSAVDLSQRLVGDIQDRCVRNATSVGRVALLAPQPTARLAAN